MINTEKFITKIRDIIISRTNFNSVYTPDLPQDGENICCVTLLPGLTVDSLCDNLYNNLAFRVLIRGNQNDTTTRALVDEVFNVLHLLKNESFTNGYIINIYGTTPMFVQRDENQRILYNMTFNANVKGE
jgi:hypothetical protein